MATGLTSEIALNRSKMLSADVCTAALTAAAACVDFLVAMMKRFKQA
jgi:hypothetical protein